MKPKLTIILTFLSALIGHGQAILYDQQSSTDETPFAHAGYSIQDASQSGQSFTPSLAGVDFVRLNLNDDNTTNGLGATLYLKLRQSNMGGTILGTTSPVTLTNGFAGPVSFFFPSTVALSPSQPYAFEVVVQSGDNWNALAAEYFYDGGTSFYRGLPISGSDLWFREGVFVPEPATGVLFAMGSALLLRARKRGVWGA